MLRRLLLLVLPGVIATVTPAIGQSPSAPAEPVPAAAPVRVEEIVVTARKRAERLEDTPVSVTALSARALQNSGITTLDQIQEVVPNLMFNRGRGNGQSAIVRIRGVGTASGEIGFDPGVGIYVDGVFLARAQGGILDTADIEQMEVLRGPQGTLFGKNTVGGAINITTAKPHDALEGFIQLRPGNFDSVRTRAMLNLPIAVGPLEDRLFTRFSFASANGGGYFHNRLLDQDSSDTNSISFLGSVRYLVTDEVTLDVAGSWARNHQNARGGQCIVIQETGLGSLAPGLYDECRRSRPFEGEANVNSLVDVKSYGAWGTLKWEPGDLGPIEDVAVRLISSWREQRVGFRDDADLTGLPVLQISSVGGGGPTDGAPNFREQISEELQVNAAALDGAVSMVAGAFVFWDRSTPGTQTSHALPGVLDSILDTQLAIDNWSWAIYGQATWEPIEWLSLTGGIRYTEDKKGTSFVTADLDASAGQIFTDWTPMASIAFTVPERFLEGVPVDHLMAYGSYAEGFKGGGFNAFINPIASELEGFGPETLENFEVGFKAVGWEQRLTVNLALFRSNYDDIQQTVLREAGDPDGDGIPAFERLTLNAASATSQGLELEIRAQPVEGLQIMGSVGYTDATFDEFLSISGRTNEQIDRAGERFPAIPELQTFLALQYSIPLDGARFPVEGILTPRIEWSYQSAVQYVGPELPDLRQRGVNLLNARLSLQLLDGDAEVALWAKNLTDEAWFDRADGFATTFGYGARYFAPPRTYGAELSYRFRAS